MTTIFLILSSLAQAALPTSAKSTLDCIAKAKSHILEFSSPVQSHSDAVRLCRGASDDAKAFDCAKLAKQDLSEQLSSSDIISLCAGATSNAPFECAKTAVKSIGSLGGAIQSATDVINLCKGTKDQTPIACADQLKAELNNKTYTSPVQSNADVIDICAPKAVTL